MGIVNNIVLDSEGNKYLNLQESNEIAENQSNNKLSNFDILYILSKANAINLVIKVRSLNDKKIYSLKKFPNSSNNNILIQTFEELKALNHSHIIKYYNYFLENSDLYLVMEYINNSDIQSYIHAHNQINKLIPEVEIWNILLQCLYALSYLSEINNKAKIKLKIIDIFLNEEQNIKIGVFNDNMYNNPNDLNYYEKQNLLFLCKILNMMLNPPFVNNNYFFQNYYSHEIKNLVNSMYNIAVNNNNQLISINSIYDYIKNEYSKKYNKNTSIKAVLENLYSYQFFNNIIINQRNKFESNKDKYFMNNQYLKCLDSLYKNDIQTFYFCIEEIRRTMALSYSKLVEDKELDPLLILTFILDRLHKENKKEINANKINGNVNEHDYNSILSSSFNEQEEDRTNQVLMLDKFVTKFNYTMNSSISDLFISFYKTERVCQTCNSKFFNFSNCLYITFDLSKRNNISKFDLIKDGFGEQNNNKKIIDSDGDDSIICERCLSYRKFEEKNTLYVLNRYLIICLIRGNKYQNFSEIIFENNIELKNYVEISDNSPHNFSLVGTINRTFYNNMEQFISRKPSNNNDKFLQKNEQIIMFFYISNDIQN